MNIVILLDGKGLQNDSSDSFDWSQPVSTKLGGSGVAGDSANDFDWSQPVSAKVNHIDMEKSDEFDWGKPVSEGLYKSSSEEDFASLKSEDSSR